MSNQSQPRPWFRLATLARASQPQTTPPTTTQPQTQGPAASLPRAPTFRPAFRPTAPAQPQPPVPRAAIPPPPPPAAAAQPPLTTRAPPPPPPSAAAPPPPSAAAPPPPSAPAFPRLPVSTPSARPTPPPSPPSAPALPRLPVSTPSARPTPPPSAPASPPKPPSPGTASPRTPPASPVAPPPKATSPLPPAPSTPPPPPVSSPTKTLMQMSPPPTTRTPPPASPPVQKTSPEIVTKREVPSSAFPSPPKPSSPAPKTSPVAARLPTPVASPREVANPLPETPKQSPVTTKPTPAAPPSPFSLPPSQAIPEAEKKTIMQETRTVPAEQKPNNGAHAKPKGRDVFWKSSDDEEGGLRVITIAGENRGAVMELGYSPRRRAAGGGVLHKVVKSEDGEMNANEGIRAKMEAAQEHENGGKTKPGLPMNAIMNSNVQGVNSSILLNSKCFHHDPGVHFSFTRKPSNGHHGQGKVNHHGNGRNNSQVRENGKWFSN